MRLISVTTQKPNLILSLSSSERRDYFIMLNILLQSINDTKEKIYLWKIRKNIYHVSIVRRNICIILLKNFLFFLINQSINLKSRRRAMYWTIFLKSFNSENTKSVGRESSYCRSIIHAASCTSSRSIPDSFYRRYYASIELSSRGSLPSSLFFSAFPLARSKKKMPPAKLRKCKLVRRLLVQRPFPSGIKLCEEVIIIKSSRRHSEGRVSPKHLVFMAGYTISVNKYL